MRPNRDAPGRVTGGGPGRRRTGGSGGPVARGRRASGCGRRSRTASARKPARSTGITGQCSGCTNGVMSTPYQRTTSPPAFWMLKRSAGAPARHAPAASRHPGEVAAPHPARRGRRRLPHVCRALLRLAGPPLRAAGKRPHCLGRFCRRRTGSHLPDVFKHDLGRRPKALSAEARRAECVAAD